MFAGIALLTICHLLCSHSKQHKVENSHRRDGTNDGDKSELVLDALLMAVWRRKPDQRVLVHSDQGSQYTSYERQAFLKEYGLESSMSRRGNCHDNAVAESFFLATSA